MEKPTPKQAEPERKVVSIPNECCYRQHKLPLMHLFTFHAKASHWPSTDRRHNIDDNTTKEPPDELDELINQLDDEAL